MVEMQQDTEIPTSDDDIDPAAVVCAELLARIVKLETAMEVVKTNMPSIQFPA